MKPFIYICFIVAIIGPCVKARSFDFGNFFFGSGKKDLDSEPPAASDPKLFDSLDYDAENDFGGFNSSLDDVFDFDYENSSSDDLEISSRNESDSIPGISDNSTAEVATTEVQNNETQSSDKNETTTSTSSTVTSEKTTSLAEKTATANSSKELPGTAEQEEVVLRTTTGATVVLIPKTFFQKSLDWVEDAYTMSILIPITAGILFATTIILVIALCRCLRRCCRRRRFKRKPLPDSVKSLTPSDRARLLGDTSDEEF